MFILKMMQTALSTGENWINRNAEVDATISLETIEIPDRNLKRQMKETSSAFAVDVLLLKFFQGLPVVGVIGGASNPTEINFTLSRTRTLFVEEQITSREHSINEY